MPTDFEAGPSAHFNQTSKEEVRLNRASHSSSDLSPDSITENHSQTQTSSTSTTQWTKENIKSLRQRLGWSQAELSHRLKCSSAEVLLWEAGRGSPPRQICNELMLLSKQAEACSDEVHSAPLAEKICDQKALGQIEFSEIKEEIE